MTETGAEMNTFAIGEDLLAAMGADLPMTTAAVEATTTVATTTVAVVMTMGLPEEDPAVAHLTTTIGTKINMDLRAHGVAIPTVRHAEGVAHRKTFAEAVAGIAIAIATARMRAFLEYHFWFVTSAPTSLTTTSVRHSDALVTFAMCTSRGITTRSKRKVLPLSNMQIQIVSTYISFFHSES